MNVVFRRAAWRPWLLLLVAVPTLALALDLTLTDRAITGWVLDVIHAPSELKADLTRGPEAREDADGLTHQGSSESRADWVWGGFMWLAGAVLLFWSFNELTASRTVLAADDDGLRLQVGSAQGSDVLLSWEQVESIRSTIDDSELGPAPVLEVTLTGPTWVPTQPSNARWDGRRLLVAANDWATPAHEAAGVLQTMLERARLRAAAGGGPEAEDEV